MVSLSSTTTLVKMRLTQIVISLGEIVLLLLLLMIVVSIVECSVRWWIGNLMRLTSTDQVLPSRVSDRDVRSRSREPSGRP